MNTEVLQQSDLFPSPAKLNGVSEVQLAVIALNIVDIIGEQGNALQVAEYIKANEKLAEFIKADKRFAEWVREDAAAYGKAGYASESGAVIKLAETGTKYDYTVCCDPVLEGLLEQQKEIGETVKARQDFLKALPKAGIKQVDEGSGETWYIFPPSKTSTSSFSVTLKK